MPEPVKAHSELLDKLRDQIARQQVIVVVGCGVSIQATGNAEAASWKGLLKSGIRRCRQQDVTLDDRWERRALEQLESPDSDEFLGVATKVARRLGKAPGALAEWLQETVGSLKPTNPAVIEALHALECPIWTTNYDGLLSTADLPPVTWTCAGCRTRCRGVVRGGSWSNGARGCRFAVDPGNRGIYLGFRLASDEANQRPE